MVCICSLIFYGLAAVGLCYLLSLLDCDIGLKLAALFGKDPSSLKGKVIWVVGASTGIGEATAVLLAKHGAKLVISSRNSDKLAVVKQICLAASSGLLSTDDILVLPLDITHVDEHTTAFDRVRNHFGRLDILFNNVGRLQRGRWHKTDISVDRQLFDTNVFGIVNLSRIAFRYFNEVGAGHVVVNSSIVGRIPGGYLAPYAASKSALLGYFDAARLENLLKPIKVTTLCFGPVDTELVEKGYSEMPGKAFGVRPKVKHWSVWMNVNRASELCVSAIVSQVVEAWIATPSMMLSFYIVYYFPALCRRIIKLLGPNSIPMQMVKEGVNFSD